MPQYRPEQPRPQKEQDKMAKMQSEIAELRKAIALKEKELQGQSKARNEFTSETTAEDRRWRTRINKRRWQKRSRTDGL